MTSARLIVFDCDGVLVDSEGISNRILADLISEAGWPMTTTECRRAFVGRRLDDVVKQVEERLMKPLPVNWLESFELLRNTAFQRHLQPIPYIAEALDQIAAAGLAQCVASSGQLTKTRFTLKLTGLSKYFAESHMFSARSVARGKPFPDVFLHAAASLGFAPDECVVIEDSVVGVQAALAAGMACLGYCPNDQEAGMSERAELGAAGAQCFDNMRTLPGLLGLPFG
ncbi:MAG: HAD family hydrolase [Rhodobacteraceae bacterium]|nr:HAD family hydrolase [Paracoccaceae bacterium]